LTTPFAAQGALRRLQNSVIHLPETVKEIVLRSPGICLFLLLLYSWRIPSIAVKPRTFVLAVLLTAFLVAYSYRILGRTPWLRRLGWLRPLRRFWVYAALAGVLAAFAVSAIARVFHVRLGTSPPHTILLASTSAAMLEELLFRGLLFWLLLELLLRHRFSTIPARIVTVLLTACGFAFAHGRTGLSLYATIGTGIAFGCMRVASQSTTAAAVMHGTFNFVLSVLAMR
jgi:hypothetical protein